jgi:EmrB/QacA subfamily drug resistance transporter
MAQDPGEPAAPGAAAGAGPSRGGGAPEAASATGAEPPASAGGRGLWVVMGALLLGLLLAALDQTIVSTALPTIASDLGGLNHLSWVVTAYLLASTAATPLWGKLGDQFGRKRLFQTAIVIFLVGSALCGISQDIGQLILFRAVQGLGGGGLIVLSMAIVGDVVPPRDRGRYQGLFGAVFGLTSVIGPLLGGFFVDTLSWRWVFYINIPVGIVALVVIAGALRIPVRRARHRIDYLGTFLIASVATSLVLMTSLGGITWAWDSWEIIGLGALGAVLLALFVVAERRAAEPVLPPSLFTIRSFTLCSVIGFIVGFAMFGALTYMPTFLQVVRGVSPTLSGVHMLPMVGGLLVASVAAGQIVSRTGHYKVFPVVGTAVMTVGLLLLHGLSAHTSNLDLSLRLLVFGVGLGLVLQVLVLIVQNSVRYENLGVATSGATFFRSIGAAFGVAIFGTIFVNRLGGELTKALAGRRLPPGFNPSRLSTDPRGLGVLPPGLRSDVLHAYSVSITYVFLYGVPLTALAFVLACFLKEQPLRKSVTAPELAQTVGPNPVERSSGDEVSRGLSLLGSREAHHDLYGRITGLAGLDLAPATSWLALRVLRHGPTDPVELNEHAAASTGDIAAAARQLEDRGLAVHEGRALVLTREGGAVAQRLVTARHETLCKLIGDWSPADNAELAELVRRLSNELCGNDSDRPGPRPAS